MTGSVIDGEDLVQDVVVKAIHAFDRSGPISHLDGWLFRIAHNVALNFLVRRARQNAVLSNEDMSMLSDSANEAEAREIATVSLRTFMRLPVAQRASVILKDVLGYSIEEVGDITGASIASVKANLHRGRASLGKLAREPDDTPLPVLREPERSRLKLYVDRFNARDFDAVREMLAEDVRLDLVNAALRRGRSGVESYLGNYGGSNEWQLSVGFLDRRPALLVQHADDPLGRPTNFILLEWAGDKVMNIRDFTHARYVVEDAEVIFADQL
jgi:RNA polymerase sigma-70 factor (ECF subfamily)